MSENYTTGNSARPIKIAHEENYDFVYLTVGEAKTIVRLLEEQEIVLEGGDKSAEAVRKAPVSKV